jgi:hypothetical protein
MKPGSPQMTAWLQALLQRKPRKLVAIALANTMAPMAWATLAKVPADRLQSVGMPEEGWMSRSEVYRRPAGAVAQ